MKISMIAVGGIDEIAPLACALGAQGHEVTVHTRREQPGKRRSSLADGVTVSLLNDPIRREALGIAAADRVRSRHSWERIARETAQVYTRISWARKTVV